MEKENGLVKWWKFLKFLQETDCNLLRNTRYSTADEESPTGSEEQETYMQNPARSDQKIPNFWKIQTKLSCFDQNLCGKLTFFINFNEIFWWCLPLPPKAIRVEDNRTFLHQLFSVGRGGEFPHVPPPYSTEQHLNAIAPIKREIGNIIFYYLLTPFETRIFSYL